MVHAWLGLSKLSEDLINVFFPESWTFRMSLYSIVYPDHVIFIRYGRLLKMVDHQSLNESSIYRYKGALGGGASAKALDTSAPIAMRIS
jgi:hypothetical protein